MLNGAVMYGANTLIAVEAPESRPSVNFISVKALTVAVKVSEIPDAPANVFVESTLRVQVLVRPEFIT
jgi:hypothetical protein